ncbi:MAG: hypothetical protein IKX17_04985 [Prevotella sp.]|nr:hypothetical protein [Prevotella sp.]
MVSPLITILIFVAFTVTSGRS